MVIIPQDQIDFMIKVMDYIRKHPNAIVIDIRQRFGLSKEEYDMIYDLMMPLIRGGNMSSYWKTKYVTLREAVSDRLRSERLKPGRNLKLADDIWAIVESNHVGPLNVNANEDLQEIG